MDSQQTAIQEDPAEQMRPKRILHIGKYFPPHRGGMETVLRERLAYLILPIRSAYLQDSNFQIPKQWKGSLAVYGELETELESVGALLSAQINEPMLNVPSGLLLLPNVAK